jgi:TnpA family transposase
MIKYASALRIGTTSAESILQRFAKNPVQHPVYKALSELGRVIKTIFLCRYLHSEALRQEIHEGLNVIERWNGVNDFILYGKQGVVSTNHRVEQEKIILCLHLLQASMVYINTLMIQEVLRLPKWENRLTYEDKRALSPLIHAHVNPYGIFPLNMESRLSIAG